MANVVLTFGQDNSPKVDPTDNVLYRDIDTNVDLHIAELSNAAQLTQVLYGENGEYGQIHQGLLSSYNLYPNKVYDFSYKVRNDSNWDILQVNPRISYDISNDGYSISVFYWYITNINNYPTNQNFIKFDIKLPCIVPYKTYSAKQLIDINAVANSLNNIFSWTPGERVLDPTFGANIKKVLFEGITAQNSELIRAEVQTAIAKYEPRIQLEDIYDISTASDTENNTIVLRIVYSVPSLPGQKFTYDYFALKR